MSDASSGQSEHTPSGVNWRRDELVARILRRWRELSGDKHTRDEQRRTLVACSAGADSVALAFVLSRVPGSCVLAHVRHDIRDPEQTHADLELVRSLGEEWGVPFVHEEVRVAQLAGNLEANARNARYDALMRMAERHDCPFIASAHHADDQLETLLMNLMRGSGLRAMGGMRPSTTLGHRTLIRPMLAVTRDEIMALLDRASLAWRDDETNADAGYTRNRIRHELVPALRAIDPEIAEHAAQWAGDLSELQSNIDAQIDQIIAKAHQTSNAWHWNRDELDDVPALLLGRLPHRFCIELLGRVGLDQLTRRAIDDWVRCLKSDATDPTTHRIGPIVSCVDAHSVRFEPAGDTRQESGAAS